jgi:hypothetical protein
MPATVQGNRNRNSTAIAWAATSARTLGQLGTPSTPNGLVFVVTQAGTTGGSEPAWNTPPFATLGTTFNDGSVIWTVTGTQPGNFPPIVQEPVDTDPPLAYAGVLPDTTLADQLAWLTFFAAKTGSNNTFTAPNLFRGTTIGSLVTITQLGTGVGLEVDGSASAANPSMTVTGNNGQIALQVDGDGSIGQYAIQGWAHAGNFAGLRGIGDGTGAGVEGVSVSGPGGNFTGGASGGVGVIGTGGDSAPGAQFFGDPGGAGFADGVQATGGLAGGVGGSFTGGVAGGVGVHGVGTNGFSGGDFSGGTLGAGISVASSSRRGAIELIPMAGFPSTPVEGDFTYNLTTHKAYIWDGSTWQNLW